MSERTQVERPVGSMIAPERELDSAPRLRRAFRLEDGHGAVASAVLRTTAFGVLEASINGSAVSDELLAPGWSSYEWRLRVVEHDVTPLLADANTIELLVGNGWFRGRLTWTGGDALYGPDRAAAAALRITYEDGHEQLIATDSTWVARSSAVLEDDLYDGQTIDARRRVEPSADDVPVRVLDFDASKLVPFGTPPIRRQQELPVAVVLRSTPGSVLLDFGQNLVGWIRLRVSGPEGAELIVRHAEVLEHGDLALRPLRSARATDRYLLSGGEDEFEPTFTLHGFRYAEISGWPGEFDPSAATAVVVHSDLRRIGTFDCSDPLLNRLHENVVWGMRGNFVGLPTDCPQRDERLGWTGDISVFTPTAASLYDVRAFLGDWLVDLALEQEHADGVVPSVVPDVLKGVTLPFTDEVGVTAIWSDAAVWVPYALWQAYGDRDALARAYGSMAAHTRKVASLLSPTGLWDTGFQYGDWLDPDASPHEPWAAKADPSVVATACAYRTAGMAADSAGVLGRVHDRDEFEALAVRIRGAFQRHYVVDGRITSDAATVYTLAIAFDLLDEPDLAAAGERLAELVAAADYRVSTGFAGTPYICDALTRTGQLDAAYRLLMERGLPSWLYPVTMGATTIWERWDSMLPDGSINPGEMTSFNHYALGSVADWMHRVIGGLAPLEPGYRRMRIAPRPGGGLTSAGTTLETPHGTAAVRWRLEGRDLRVEAEVPPGTTAVADLPDGRLLELQPGWHYFTVLVPAGTAGVPNVRNGR